MDVERTTRRCTYQNSSSHENLPSDTMLIRDAELATLWSAQQDAGPFREIRGGKEAFFRHQFDFFSTLHSIIFIWTW